MPSETVESGASGRKTLNRRAMIPTLKVMVRSRTRHVISRCATIVLLAGLAACARIDHNPPVIQGERPSGAELPQQAVGAGRIRVQEGDSLYAIARQNGVALRGLIDANGLKAPYIIFPGQILTMPGKRYHVVADDESIYAISQLYDVDMGALVRINNIPPPYRIAKGQRLRLPAGSNIRQVSTTHSSPDRADRAPAIAEAPSPVAGPSRLPTREVRPVEPAPAPRVAKAEPRPLGEPPRRSSGKFLWPVRGRLIVGFGPREGGFHNDGINIAAPEGTPVLAAENGIVVYSGNQLQGFGNMVLIKHSGGWMTAYAHNSKILVGRGDTVRRGQKIAQVGSSGSVSRPQLHFELRRGDRAVDPRRYLVRYAWMGRGPVLALMAQPAD